MVHDVVKFGGADLRPRRPVLGCDDLRKGGVARDVVLPQLALGLVNRHRESVREICALELGGELPVVHCVTELVERPDERLDCRPGVAGRQTRVARRDGRREWVCRSIQTPARALDPEPRERRLDSGALDALRYVESRRRRLVGVRNERRQLVRQSCEEVRDGDGGEAVVVVAEEGVVCALAVDGHAGRVVARENEISFEGRQESPEVVGGPCLLPKLLPGRAGARALRREVVRHLLRPFVVAARQADDVAMQVGKVRAIELGEPLPELWRRCSLVRQSRERPACARALAGALRGHHHELVPGQHRLDRHQVGDLGNALLEAFDRVQALENKRSNRGARGYSSKACSSQSANLRKPTEA